MRVFISQDTMDDWVASGMVGLEGDRLTVRAAPAALRIVPALYFHKLSAGNDEPHRFLGKVKDDKAIAAVGGEAFMNSVLIGDAAYDVTPGFLSVAPPDADGRAVLDALRALPT